ncbi:MAG: type II secretion system protein [Thermodesulfovibrionales bacterium]|nr:type II secretion system protein [Thermodesulfovibrionales bacterium]
MKGLNYRGFTLIEVVITMVLVAIIAYILADALRTGVNAYIITDQRKEALDAGRVAMERMTREIRGAMAVNSVSATEFCFKAIDGTTLGFRLSGGNILRNNGWTSCPPTTGGTDNTLASDISLLSFARVLNTVIIDLTSTVSGEAVPLRSMVWLRGTP